MKLKKFVRIIKGEYKGYTGTILEISKGQYMIRVDTNNRTVALNKDGFVPLDINQASVEIKTDKKSSSIISQRSRTSSSKSSVSSRNSSIYKSGSQKIQSQNYDKGNYFKNLEQKIKETKNPYLFDVSEFLQLTDIGESFVDVRDADQINKIVSNTNLKNQDVNKKLFIIAYYFIQLNRKNMQLPYRTIFKDIVTPNDNYNYILNAAVLLKYLQKQQVDTAKLEMYIDIILKYLNAGLISYTQRNEVLQRIRERRAQIKFPAPFVPKLQTMKFVKRKTSEAREIALQARNKIIDGYITDIKSGNLTIPANVNKEFVINSLETVKHVKSIKTPHMGKNPDDVYLESLINVIKIKERQLINEAEFPEIEKPIKEEANNKIRNLIISRINAQLFDQKTSNVLSQYVLNIEDPKYYQNLTSSEKVIVDPYRRYYNLLVKSYLEALPARFLKRKTSVISYNPIQLKIKEKIINLEKGRIRKMITTFPQHADILHVLANNYNEMISNIGFKQIKEIEVDKNSGMYTDDEIMLKLSQRELYSRLNDMLTKNFQNLNFYSVRSREKLVD